MAGQRPSRARQPSSRTHPKAVFGPCRRAPRASRRVPSDPPITDEMSHCPALPPSALLFTALRAKSKNSGQPARARRCRLLPSFAPFAARSGPCETGKETGRPRTHRARNSHRRLKPEWPATRRLCARRASNAAGTAPIARNRRNRESTARPRARRAGIAPKARGEVGAAPGAPAAQTHRPRAQRNFLRGIARQITRRPPSARRNSRPD